MPIQIRWLGHATVLVEDRARILTDPVLTGAMMHLHRRAGPVPGSLTSEVDAVAISHLHVDHLHFPSLALIDAGTPVLIPRGAGRLLRGTGLEAVEVVAGEEVRVGGATITVVPAVHDATRWPFGRVRGEAVGYVVRGDGATYFAGDTSLFPEMHDIAGHLDMALHPGRRLGALAARGAHEPEGCGELPRPARRRGRRTDPLRDVLAAWHQLGQEAGVPRTRSRVRSTREESGAGGGGPGVVTRVLDDGGSARSPPGRRLSPGQGSSMVCSTGSSAFSAGAARNSSTTRTSTMAMMITTALTPVGWSIPR